MIVLAVLLQSLQQSIQRVGRTVYHLGQHQLADRHLSEELDGLVTEVVCQADELQFQRFSDGPSLFGTQVLDHLVHRHR